MPLTNAVCSTSSSKGIVGTLIAELLSRCVTRTVRDTVRASWSQQDHLLSASKALPASHRSLYKQSTHPPTHPHTHAPPSSCCKQESSNLLPFTPSPLRNEDYMGDVFIRKARQRRDFKFVYKRKIFLHSHPWPSPDPAFNRLVYLQVRRDCFKLFSLVADKPCGSCG